MTISSSGNVDIHGGDLNITGSQTVSEDMTVSGKLTAGTTEITGTTVAALDNLVLGESSNNKVVTQNNEGKIKIGSTDGSQTFNIASHDGINGGLLLNNVLIKSSASDINKVHNITDGITEAIKLLY